jgi:uncharacterized pyridoxal phosphate-dependent enzyme
MMRPPKKTGKQKSTKFSRRELFRLGSILALPAMFSRKMAATPANKGKLQLGKELYPSIGVKPLINARGTYTIISGSLMLPEVRAAMSEASQHYVHLDELAEAVGARLAELTKAEWGMVSSGCAAALTHATAACVAGGNPDLHVRIPDLKGFPKDEVIIPRHSRNVYDAAVRAVGVRIIEVGTVDDLELALGPRTAMIYILAGPEVDESPLNTRVICALARKRGVPVLVDAAAEILTVPNVHLGYGADLVGYSGGKCIRGPQSAGLLLGRKDLVRAAWIHSAPHHGFARAMKVGKEEAMGMLMAVEMWMQRDHTTEWNRWRQWLEHIAASVSSFQGVTTTFIDPKGLSNRTPNLAIRWDQARLGISGETVARLLFDTDPRIATLGQIGGKNKSETGILINPYMMSDGDESVVADRIVAILSSAPKPGTPVDKPAPTCDLSGQWDVQIDYVAGRSSHTLNLRQKGAQIEGSHQGDFVCRDLSGTIEGDSVRLFSAYTEQHGDSLMYTFTGKVQGEEISGVLDLGEYLKAQWIAKRHNYLKG